MCRSGRALNMKHGNYALCSRYTYMYIHKTFIHSFGFLFSVNGKLGKITWHHCARLNGDVEQLQSYFKQEVICAIFWNNFYSGKFYKLFLETNMTVVTLVIRLKSKYYFFCYSVIKLFYHIRALVRANMPWYYTVEHSKNTEQQIGRTERSKLYRYLDFF